MTGWQEGESARRIREAGEREAELDRRAAEQTAQDRASLAYRPELPPAPTYKATPPTAADDPWFWADVERVYGHWPVNAASTGAAVDEVLEQRRRS